MTSLAFVLGVLPLAIANGAGSGSENAVGRGVIGGMLSATFLAPFLIPMFFVVITRKAVQDEARGGRGAVRTHRARGWWSDAMKRDRDFDRGSGDKASASRPSR